MDTDSPHQNNAPKNKKEAVHGSIKKLKEKFVPTTKYTLLITAATDFAMLVIGCLNVHNCPVNIKIPLFLIATGAIGLMSKFVSYAKNRVSAHVHLVHLESALYSTETIFFILGTYWVYKEFQPSYEPNHGDKYCNKTAYIAAFVYITVFYAFILAIIFGFCCFICCALCLATTLTTEDSEAPSENAGSVPKPLTTEAISITVPTNTTDTRVVEAKTYKDLEKKV